MLDSISCAVYTWGVWRDLLHYCSMKHNTRLEPAVTMQSDCSNVTSPMSSTSCVSNNKICDKMQTDGCDDRQDHVNNVFDLLHVHDVPDHHKEISILTGYRQRLEYSDCMKSIFKLHNETINIWTHLLGFVFFFMLMMKDVMWRQEHIRDSADYSATVLQLITYQVPILH